jgi:hypothetical protein
MSETQKTHFADDATLAHIAKLERELSDCRKECEEQARLNGMGSQREARLMAELAEARLESAEHSAKHWEEEARRYAGNADYWRERLAKARTIAWDWGQGVTDAETAIRLLHKMFPIEGDSHE